jgi:hypothetical protein
MQAAISVINCDIRIAGTTFSGLNPRIISIGAIAVPYPIPRLESRYSLTKAIIPTNIGIFYSTLNKTPAFG